MKYDLECVRCLWHMEYDEDIDPTYCPKCAKEKIAELELSYALLDKENEENSQNLDYYEKRCEELESNIDEYIKLYKLSSENYEELEKENLYSRERYNQIGQAHGDKIKRIAELESQVYAVNNIFGLKEFNFDKLKEIQKKKLELEQENKELKDRLDKGTMYLLCAKELNQKNQTNKIIQQLKEKIANLEKEVERLKKLSQPRKRSKEEKKKLFEDAFGDDEGVE